MEEIGRRLQETRVAKGITLQEVEEETRIRKKYIEALESGRTVLIPGEVYVKGFLRTYGNFLGLDGEALVEEYKQRKNRPPVDDEAEGADSAAGHRGDGSVTRRAGASVGGSAEDEVAAAGQAGSQATFAPRPPAFVQAPRRSGRSRAKRRQRGPGPGVYFLRRAAVLLLVILPVAGLGYWLWNQQAARPQPPSDPVVQEPAPVTTPPDTTPVTEPEPSTEQQPEPEPQKPEVTMTGPARPGDQLVRFSVSASPIKVRMEGFTGPPVWMAWTVDGKEVYSGKPTEPVEFEGQQIEINVGHLQGVDLVINGEPFDHGLDGGPYILQFGTP